MEGCRPPGRLMLKLSVHSECLAEQGISKDGLTFKFKAKTVGVAQQKPRGAAPHADYFLCTAKESNQRNAAPVHRRCAVPCVARLVRRLRNSRYALRQSSPKPPGQSALLGGSQGNEIQNRKPKTSEAGQPASPTSRRNCARSAHKTAVDFPSPVRRLDQARTGGAVGRALFEHVAA